MAEGKPPFLIVAFYYPPDAASGAARPHRFAKYLSRLGHVVKVIAADQGQQSTFDYVHRVRAEIDGSPSKDLPGFIERCFRKTFFHHDPGVTWIPRVAAKARELYPKQKPIVITTAPPATTHVAGLLLKMLYGWPWIADFRDPMTGNPFRAHWSTQKIDPWLERLIFRHADALIANTDAVANIWRSRFPQWASKMHLVWNGYDPEEAAGPLPAPSEGPKLLSHMGVIYGDRDPLSIVSALQSLMRDGLTNPAELRVRLLGPLMPNAPETIPALDEIAKEGWLEMRKEFIPKQEAATITQTSHYLLLLDVLGPKAGLQVPAKLFEYICVGRPILASTTEGSPLAGILDKSGIPHVCFYGDNTAEVRKKMAELLKLPPDAVQPSEWFQQNFNATNQAAQVSAIAASIYRRS